MTARRFTIIRSAHAVDIRGIHVRVRPVDLDSLALNSSQCVGGRPPVSPLLSSWVHISQSFLTFLTSLLLSLCPVQSRQHVSHSVVILTSNVHNPLVEQVHHAAEYNHCEDGHEHVRLKT